MIVCWTGAGAGATAAEYIWYNIGNVDFTY